MSNPYPDENGWWSQVAIPAIDSVYNEAIAVGTYPSPPYYSFDSGRFMWYTRTAYDLREEDKDVALARHVQELRVALGLSIGPEPPPIGKFLPVSVNGKYFVTDDGVFQGRGLTAFCLYKDFLDGKDIDPFLNYALSVEANTVRVFGMMHYITRFYPREYPAYLESVVPFIHYVNQFGIHVEFVIFADAQEIMPGQSEQLDWWDTVCPLLDDFEEYCNEPFKNGVDVSKLPQDEGAVFAYGKYDYEGQPQVIPYGTYITHHPPRDSEWPRKCKDIIEYRDHHGVPAWANEIMGAANYNEPGRRSNSVTDFRDSGGVAGLFGHATMHSDELIYARIPQATEDECVRAFIGAMKCVPPYVQTWQYTGGHLGDCPMEHSDSYASRTYAMMSDNEAYCQIVRPTDQNPRRAQNGWTIVDNWYNLYRLTR